MATVTKPIALDESLNTTELSSRNVADVLAQELSAVATAIGGIAVPSADHVSYDNSGSGLSATDVQNALDEIVSDIPTVNDGTLTIQQNGETKGTFTANQNGNSTVNIETPTADIQTAVDEFETYNGGLLSECKVTLVPVQSGSGDPSPDNVRPISGHTQVEVDVSDGQTTQEQVTVNLGGTYYSGILDIVTGVFTPDMIVKDMGDITYNYNSTENIFGTEIISDMASPIPTKVQLRCSALNALTPKDIAGIKNADDNSIAFNSSATKFMRIKCTSYTDGNALKTAMTGQKIVYEIANPTPIQLSPTMVKALVGENHLSAPLDGQEITESKYKQMFTFDDVIAYIQSLS